MSHVVNDQCIECKALDCVEVCPVECFHEGENMVVIDPETCINCGVCVDVCEPKAILPPPELSSYTKPEEQSYEHWLALNHRYSRRWPQASVLSVAMTPCVQAPKKMALFSPSARKDVSCT